MSGEKVRVWKDNWIPSLPLGHPVPFGVVAVSPNLKVSSLFDHASCQWNLDFLQPFISPVELDAIQALHIGDPRKIDRLVWALVDFLGPAFWIWFLIFLGLTRCLLFGW